MSIVIKKRYTEKEIEDIYKTEKTLREVISWRIKDNNYTKYVANADVYIGNTKIGELHCSYNIGGEIKFRLYTKYNQLIRMFHSNQNHKNPNGELIRGSHKHKYTDMYDWSMAYPVEDIDISDVNKALLDFLNECNIKVDEELMPIPLGKQPFIIRKTLIDYMGETK